MFQKGHQRFGGKKKGTPNKKTKFVRDSITAIIERYFDDEQFQRDLQQMCAKDRALVMERFTAYVIPKLQATSVDMVNERKETIEDRLIALSASQELPGGGVQMAVMNCHVLPSDVPEAFQPDEDDDEEYAE